MLYRLCVKRLFSARHYLIGGDWGAENQPHGHDYSLELELAGASLNRHGYLVDIVEVGRQLDSLVAQYRDQMLNDLPQFAGLNPSIEHFSRILCLQLNGSFQDAAISGLTVRLWENDIAWTSFSVER